jgi:hypothetical protein
MKHKQFIYYIIVTLFSMDSAICEEDRKSFASDSSSNTISIQRQLTEFTINSILVLKKCQEADDLFVKSLAAFLDYDWGRACICA